jgi:hypothetical protein
VDVAGTSRDLPDVTVCSNLRGADSLPTGRWDTIVLADAGPALPQRLEAIKPACRIPARVVLMERGSRATSRDRALTLAKLGTLDKSLIRRGRFVCVAEVNR